MSAANVASLVFFAFSLLAALGVAYLGHAFAEEAGVNEWGFAMAPALFAALYSHIVYQDAERNVRRLGQSIYRGILVASLTWVSVATLTTLTWCSLRDFASCLGKSLLVSAVIGASPILAAALGAGILTFALISRRPPSG